MLHIRKLKDRYLLEKQKKVIRLMKDEVVGLQPKAYADIKNDGTE